MLSMSRAHLSTSCIKPCIKHAFTSTASIEHPTLLLSFQTMPIKVFLGYYESWISGRVRDGDV